MRLADAKTLAETIEASLKCLALLTAGGWTYWQFVLKRGRMARAAITHEAFVLARAAGKRLLRVSVVVENKGSTRIRFNYARVRLAQMYPLPSEVEEGLVANAEPERCEPHLLYKWKSLESREPRVSHGGSDVEPGSREEFHFDFAVPEHVETIAIYSYFRNSRKSSRRVEVGWSSESLWAINASVGQGRAIRLGADPTLEKGVRDVEALPATKLAS
jgi:hypothetical protein